MKDNAFFAIFLTFLPWINTTLQYIVNPKVWYLPFFEVVYHILKCESTYGTYGSYYGCNYTCNTHVHIHLYMYAYMGHIHSVYIHTFLKHILVLKKWRESLASNVNLKLNLSLRLTNVIKSSDDILTSFMLPIWIF